MLLPVLNVTASDAHLASLGLEICAHLDGCVDSDLLLVHPDGFDPAAVVTLARTAFKRVTLASYPPWSGDATWPKPTNWAWQRVAKLIHRHIGANARHIGWLWWEADAVPLRRGWLAALSAAYRCKPRAAFAGASATTHTGAPYMHACGVYPFTIVDELSNTGALYDMSQPFDVAAGHSVMSSFKLLTEIAVHPQFYFKTGSGLSGYPSFNEQRLKELLQTPAVFYRGCVDTTLQLLLLGRDLPRRTSTPLTIAANGSLPRYTISVLCMNHCDLTQQCIESIIKHSGDSYELFVTDNASTDSTPRYLKQMKRTMGDRLTVITNTENQGFQDPNEHVLTQARGEFFLLFNNDMVACEGWLDHLSAPFADPTVAITGIAGTCCAINSAFKGTAGDDTKPEYIEGGCLMIPTALARRHGLFADYLRFIYWEDTDLSLRMRELGYRVATVPIPIRHDHRSATTKHLDLRAVIQHNHDAMWKEWRFYMQRRNFERRVTVRRRGARGDVLLLTPALAALAAKWPQAHIYVETAHPEMVDGCLPQVTPHPHAQPDLLFNLDTAYEARPDVHIVQAFADALGVKLPTTWRIHMTCTDSDLAWAFRATRGMKVALVHGGFTTWPGKNWPIDRMAAIVDHLSDAGYLTIAVGASDSPPCGCHLSVAGLTTPQQMFALAKHASLFVGLDSMPQHIASAADVPSVVLFGATNPACILRPSPRIKAVQATTADAECVGAHGRRTGIAFDSLCEGDCMRAITVDMVQQAIKEVQNG